MTFLVDGTLGGTFPSWTTATRPASPAVGQMGYNTTTGLFDQYVGSAWQSISTGTGAVPTLTTYTSGSGTYTTPTGAKFLVVEMVAGGGGGGGGGNNSTAGQGGQGGSTTFGTSLLACTGSLGAPTSSAVGTATINSPAYGIASAGALGQGFQALVTSSVYMSGGTGGASPFGGNGNGGANGAGTAATANTGSGGGGGGNNGAAPAFAGAGSGSGGYIKAIIPTPSATYSYAVGAGGAGGTAGTNGYAGAAGGSGVIYVTAYF